MKDWVIPVILLAIAGFSMTLLIQMNHGDIEDLQRRVNILEKVK